MDRSISNRSITNGSITNRFETFAVQYRSRPGSLAVRLFVIMSAIATVGVLFSLILYILIKGIANITPDLFAWEFTTENMSMMPALISTIYITLLTLGIAVPAGVFSAIYLVEYATRGSKIVKIIRTTTETLQGIPSIVYGLFGYILFVVTLGWSYSIIAGALTLAIMVLPLIIRTTEEALLSVPDSYREGSFGLGAGKLRTVFRVILPPAVPGILSGVILAMGRIVGESAALIFTAGSVAQVPGSLFDSARTLSVHMYALLTEGLHTGQAYGTAVVLLALVVIINGTSNLIAKRLAAN